MAYHCRDCSYKGKQSSAGGLCPACGSAKFERAAGVLTLDNSEKPGNGSLIAVILLWGFLIGHIYWKFYG
jgi:hypothetical protein